MAFRDDREALRAKSDALEADLAEAQERLLELESRGDADQRELRRLRRQLARAVPSRRVPVLSILVTLLFLLGVIGGMLAFSQDDEAPSDTVDEPEQAPLARIETPPRVAFGAQVIRSTGATIDSGCVFVANLERGPTVSRLVARCDDQVLFDSNVEQPGVRIRDHQVHEIEQHELLQYRLRYRDTGSAGTQIVVDSQHRRARIWNDTVDLRFAMDDRSGARAGARFGQPLSQPIADSLHVRAVPVSSRGNAPVLGEICELRVHPAVGRESQNCRIVVDCGTILYGANNGGYNECTFDEGRPDTARDSRGADFDGDPKLTLNFQDRTLVVEDGWRHEFTLEEDERCQIAGAWDGDFRSMGLYVFTQNGRTLATTDLADSMVWDARVDLDCKSGQGTIEIDDHGLFEGRFGPGFQTFVGHVRSLDATTFYLMRTE